LGFNIARQANPYGVHRCSAALFGLPNTIGNTSPEVTEEGGSVSRSRLVPASQNDAICVSQSQSAFTAADLHAENMKLAGIQVQILRFSSKFSLRTFAFRYPPFFDQAGGYDAYCAALQAGPFRYPYPGDRLKLP